MVMLAATAASADPAKPPAPASTSTSPASTSTSPPGPLVLTPMLLVEVPKLPPVSLRLEAVRVAGMRSDTDWRYPEPGPLLGVDGGAWFLGVGYYRPRTRRSAALHGGSIAATILGEVLTGAHSPFAAVGALATGATLDAAAADVDRDAESRKK
jgi:hypothetical protein